MTRFIISGLVICMVALSATLAWVLTRQPLDNEPLRIAITNWPGFDYLYLASEKGFFAAEGLNIEWLNLNSLTTVRLAYKRGLIDGYTGTEVEVADAMLLGHAPGRVVLLADYSNGADMILAKPGIATLQSLAGHKVGAEITSPLGHYVLVRALQQVSLTLAGIEAVSYVQAELAPAMHQGNIDAALTYQPFAGQMQNDQPLHRLFDSSQIPAEIIDVLAVNPQVLKRIPDLSRRLQRVWQRSLDYAASHRDETDALFAKRYNLSVADYRAGMTTIKMLSVPDMQNLARGNTVQTAMFKVASIIGDGKQLDAADVSNTIAIWQGL